MVAKKEKLIASISILITGLAVVAIAILLVLDTLGIVGADKLATEKSLVLTLDAPESAEQGASSGWQLSINNKTGEDKTVIVNVVGQGIDVTAVSENDSTLSVLPASTALEKFGENWGSNDGLVWQVGVIKKDKTATLDFIGTPTLATGDEALVKVVAYEQKQGGNRCGFLWLAKCNISITEDVLNEVEAGTVITATNQNRDAITLGKGYNLISLPVTMSNATISQFWGQFTNPIGWHLDATSQSWQNVTESGNYKYIKPCNGMWVYQPDGGEILIPDGTAVDPEADYSVTLGSGWNQIGNPYKYRIKLDGDKILVKRSGKETLTLSGALEQGIITKIIGMAGAQSSSSTTSSTDPSYIEIVVGRYLPIGSGLFMNTTEAATLVFPGESIFAPGELISSVEKAKIINWINSNGLDVCGNNPSSSLGENPLRDDQTGEILDQFDCVLIKHTDRPWN